MTLISGGQAISLINSSGPILADGAVGTMLLSQGIDAEDILPSNLAHRELVSRIHEEYLAAGSQLITSNTFGVRTGGRWLEHSRAGLALAQSAAASAPQEIGVLFSLISSHVVPEQDNIERIIDECTTCAPIILLETCTSLNTIMSAVTTLKQRLPQVPLAVTCHFTSECKMVDGTSAGNAAKHLACLGVNAVGVNCSDSSIAVINATVQMYEAVQLPIFAQPNAGQPILGNDRTMKWELLPSEFADVAASLIKCGASVIGGCCGTRPEHILAAARVLQSHTTHLRRA